MAARRSTEHIEYIQTRNILPSRTTCNSMVQQHPAGLAASGGRQTHPHIQPVAYVSLAEVVTARPQGITEQETWALLCQAVQALQDLFLSDGVSGGRFVPAVCPTALLLSNRGRVTLALSRPTSPAIPPPAAANYTAPEYHPQRAHKYTDADVEKMLVYSLGECLKRVALPTHLATSRLSTELCVVLTTMGKQLPSERASLMHLLDIISDYNKRRDQVKPFSHIVMDLYRETIIYRHSTPIIPDCSQQALFKQYMVQPYSDRNDILPRKVDHFDNHKTIPSWREPFLDYRSSRLTRNLFASLEHLNKIELQPITQQRPKSICTNEELLLMNNEPRIPHPHALAEMRRIHQPTQRIDNEQVISKAVHKGRRQNMKRNPVKRAASRLYHVNDDYKARQSCIGPEFVIRASLPSKQLVVGDGTLGNSKMLTVIMLNGIKIEVNCKPELTTAGQLFEKIIRTQDIEENYFLGLSVLIAGDFVFLPSDVKLSKIITMDAADTRFTLFVRIRFFLPSLRGMRSQQSKHLLYLQLRRSILESQLPCSLEQLHELGGLALQAEFGDYSKKHEANHYFLLEHYVPENLIGSTEANEHFRERLTRAHIQRSGLTVEKAEEDFILLAQSLPSYGVHFYSAVLVTKNSQRDVWLCVSAQGINLFERSGTIIPHGNPLAYEIFKWQDIQTLCYSKHYLCILPHATKARKTKPRKYKLKMDHKKSYYTFRLASLHHQFFLRLKTEYSSLQSLSQQFGILLKDMKNEANSLFKLASSTSDEKAKASKLTNELDNNNRSSKCKRSKSVHELSYKNIPLEEFQNKENEKPAAKSDRLYVTNTIPYTSQWDKRKGVKMGIRAFTSNGVRMSRSLEAVNAWNNEEQEKVSLESSSRLSNASSGIPNNADIYVLDSSIKSLDDQFLPDFQETLSQSLMEKLKNLSFADERILKTVTIERDGLGSLGIQVTEGSDGKAYIQSVVPYGPASDTGNVFKGDQIVAVDGQNLLNMKYADALQILKQTDNKVEFILSQMANHETAPVQCFQAPARNKFYEKTFLDTSNYDLLKFDHKTDIFQYSPYINHNNHEQQTDCQRIYSNSLERRMKLSPLPTTSEMYNFNLDDSTTSSTNKSQQACSHNHGPLDFAENIPPKCDNEADLKKLMSVSQVALPRSLGLGRKWRGPVRYPVTPIKSSFQQNPDNSDTINILNASDDEQIFI